jgi:hypothetical protein
MENVVNLADRRKKAEPEPERLPENAAEIMAAFVEEYLNRAVDDTPMATLIAYAKDAMEHELRSMPFDEALERIEKEYPDLTCQFKKDMSV